VICAYDGGPAELASGRVIACAPGLRQSLIDGLAACGPLSGASFGAPELDVEPTP
jgi:myo-inositol-1(or 4)-monophosphatase